jgi:hypothetical protein
LANTTEYWRTYRKTPWGIKRTKERCWKSKYGIENFTYEDYIKLYEMQNGRCGICKTEIILKGEIWDQTTARVDHDKETKRVRGLLCNKCNMVVGRIAETSKMLEALNVYMKGGS